MAAALYSDISAMFGISVKSWSLLTGLLYSKSYLSCVCLIAQVLVSIEISRELVSS